LGRFVADAPPAMPPELVDAGFYCFRPLHSSLPGSPIQAC